MSAPAVDVRVLLHFFCSSDVFSIVSVGNSFIFCGGAVLLYGRSCPSCVRVVTLQVLSLLVFCRIMARSVNVVRVFPEIVEDFS
jgi:hypothetical protein